MKQWSDSLVFKMAIYLAGIVYVTSRNVWWNISYV